MSLPAHGGVGGATVEIGLTLTILLALIAVWRRERTSKSDDLP